MVRHRVFGVGGIMRRDLHEANRLSWNAATVAHNSHKGDQAAFFRSGGSTLFPEELDLLGDVADAHLAMPQHVEDAQTCRLGQRAEVVRHVLKRIGRELLHRSQENHLQVGRGLTTVYWRFGIVG